MSISFTLVDLIDDLQTDLLALFDVVEPIIEFSSIFRFGDFIEYFFSHGKLYFISMESNQFMNLY